MISDINSRHNSIFPLCQLLLFYPDLLGGISDIYLLAFFIRAHLYAYRNNCSPAVARTENHNRSYFLSGPPPPFFSQGPSLHRCFTVDITELRGDKEAEKNNNRPIDPHFTNLGGMGEIHLQVWSRLLIGPRQAFFLFFLGTRSAAEGPDWCHFLSNVAFQTSSVDVYLKSCATVSKNLGDKWISTQSTY